jgi:hypothetical protein
MRIQETTTFKQVKLHSHFFNMDVVYAGIAGANDGQQVEMAEHPCTAHWLLLTN